MELGQMFQVGIVTDNLENMLKEFEKFGLKDWEQVDFGPDTISGMIINDKPGEMIFKGAMCKHGNMEIELIEPVSDSIFKDWLNEHGPGIHHLAFKPKEGYETFMEDFRANGYKSLIDVLNGEKTAGFSYLDTFRQLGFYIEVHKTLSEK